MFHEMMEEWLKSEQRKILFPQYKEEDVFMLEEFVNYLDATARQAAEQSVQPTLLTLCLYCERVHDSRVACPEYIAKSQSG
jgi:hypothetical protein